MRRKIISVFLFILVICAFYSGHAFASGAKDVYIKSYTYSNEAIENRWEGWWHDGNIKYEKPHKMKVQ